MNPISFAQSNQDVRGDAAECQYEVSPLNSREAYDIAAARYDAWAWQKVWHLYEWPLIEEAIHSAPRSRRVLDIGVGTATYLERLARPGRELCGLDNSWAMLQRAKERLAGRAVLVEADAAAMPFPRRSFDLILMNRVATHLPNVSVLARQFRLLLDRHGTVIVSDVSPDHPYSVTALPVAEGKIPVETYKHSIQEWQQALFCAGLVMVSMQEVNNLDYGQLPRGWLRSIDRSHERPIGFVLVARAA